MYESFPTILKRVTRPHILTNVAINTAHRDHHSEPKGSHSRPDFPDGYGSVWLRQCLCSSK